jgi:hypothetical protein
VAAAVVVALTFHQTEQLQAAQIPAAVAAVVLAVELQAARAAPVLLLLDIMPQ